MVKDRLGLPATGTTAEKEQEMTKAMTGMVAAGAKSEPQGTEVAKTDGQV